MGVDLLFSHSLLELMLNLHHILPQPYPSASAALHHLNKYLIAGRFSLCICNFAPEDLRRIPGLSYCPNSRL